MHERVDDTSDGHYQLIAMRLTMEFRDSGRDPVQIKDDGTHVIVPATAHPTGAPNACDVAPSR
jgi:hypothetical protein